MKISDKTYILILIIIILVLSLITYGRFEKFRLVLPETELPRVEMPKIEPGWEDTLFPESEGKQDWASPDGKLKLTYPASWQEMGQDVLKHSDESGIILMESEVLLFAHRFKLQEQAFALLMVSQASAEKNLEEILEEMEQSIKEEEGEIEIIILEIEDGIARLEMISKYANQINFYSKGKIIFAQEKTYLIFLASPQKDWPQFEEEAREIFDSIRLL